MAARPPFIDPRPPNSLEQLLLPVPKSISRPLPPQPPLNHLHNVRLLLPRQLPPLYNPMPFRQTRSTARPRRMLCDKNRVPPHRRLLPILDRLRRRQALGNEPFGVPQKLIQTVPLQVPSFHFPQLKPRPEARLFQRFKYLIQIAHAPLLRDTDGTAAGTQSAKDCCLAFPQILM